MVYHGSSRLIMPEIHYCRWMDSEWRLILFGNYCVISSPVRFKHNHGYIMVANMISNRVLTHICLSHIFLFFYINGVRKGFIIVIMILSGVTMATIIIFNHNDHLETWLWIQSCESWWIQRVSLYHHQIQKMMSISVQSQSLCDGNVFWRCLKISVAHIQFVKKPFPEFPLGYGLVYQATNIGNIVYKLVLNHVGWTHIQSVRFIFSKRHIGVWGLSIDSMEWRGEGSSVGLHRAFRGLFDYSQWRHVSCLKSAVFCLAANLWIGHLTTDYWCEENINGNIWIF